MPSQDQVLVLVSQDGREFPTSRAGAIAFSGMIRRMLQFAPPETALESKLKLPFPDISSSVLGPLASLFRDGLDGVHVDVVSYFAHFASDAHALAEVVLALEYLDVA